MRSAFNFYVIDEHVVEAFERDRLGLEYFHEVVGGLVNAGVSEQEEDTLGVVVNQVDLGFQEGYACRFGADESATDVEAAVLAGDQLVEVVPGDAARDVGIVLVDEIGVTIVKGFEL